VASTPPAWVPFARRNAELAARLAEYGEQVRSASPAPIAQTHA
jgi:hypothetical protein